MKQFLRLSTCFATGEDRQWHKIRKAGLLLLFFTFSAAVLLAQPCSPPLPVSAIASNAHICKGETVHLEAIGGTSYTWAAGQQTVGTMGSITVTPTVTTTYTVTAVNGPCTGSAAVTVQVEDCNDPLIPTGIKANAYAANRLDVYPNPSQGLLNIAAGENAAFDQIQIMDLQGRLVKNYDLEFARTVYEIKEPGLEPGIYFIYVVKENRLVAIKKVSITG